MPIKRSTPVLKRAWIVGAAFLPSGELVPLTAELLKAEIAEEPWRRTGWRAVVRNPQLVGTIGVAAERFHVPIVDGVGILKSAGQATPSGEQPDPEHP